MLSCSCIMLSCSWTFLFSERHSGDSQRARIGAEIRRRRPAGPGKSLPDRLSGGRGFGEFSPTFPQDFFYFYDVTLCALGFFGAVRESGEQPKLQYFTGKATGRSADGSLWIDPVYRTLIFLNSLTGCPRCVSFLNSVSFRFRILTRSRILIVPWDFDMINWSVFPHWYPEPRENLGILTEYC